MIELATRSSSRGQSGLRGMTSPLVSTGAKAASFVFELVGKEWPMGLEMQFNSLSNGVRNWVGSSVIHTFPTGWLGAWPAQSMSMQKDGEVGV
jgi:hypothetical protein